MMAEAQSPKSGPHSRVAILSSTASLPLRSTNSAAPPISIDQAWRGILRLVRGDSDFAPKFVQTEVLTESEMLIVKRVQHYAGTDNAPPKREQITHLYPGYLAVTRYSDGPFFIAMVGLDLADPSDPKMFLTTIRHTQDPSFRDPAETARERGMAPPPTTEQNLGRVLETIRRLIAEASL